jgi:integrase
MIPELVPARMLNEYAYCHRHSGSRKGGFRFVKATTEVHLSRGRLAPLDAPNWKRTPTGLRNRVAMQLMYRCGLRNSEVCGISVYDVDRAGRLLHVQSGKGYKDRNVPVSRTRWSGVSGGLTGAVRC